MIRYKITDKDRETQYQNMLRATDNYNAENINQVGNLKASKIRSLVNAYIIMETYKNKSKVAYAGEQFPNEILFPFDIRPLNIESMAAFFARSDAIEKFLKVTEENNLARDICTNIRSSFGIALANCYPTPDIIMVNNHPCDCLAKLAYIMADFYDKPYLALDVPNYLNDDSISYLVKQFKSIMKDIERLTNIKYNEEKFTKVIDYSNQAKEYFINTVKLTEKYRLPEISRELYEIFATNPWGLKEAVDICKTLYEEAFELSKKLDSNEKWKKVLWVGQLPNHTFEIIEYLEKHVEIIYWGALMDSNMYLLDKEEPFKSLAIRSILYMWNTDRFKKSITDVYNRFKMDGIIIINAWGCRNLQGLSQMLRVFATENNIKYLTIDADYMDRNNYAFSHVKNRIDAFLEII
ncbi:2-hydroxyacyl-CoA dehydratase family protein [Paramaledivibacter caminithermalis]|jgi:benzoyl-CoA reductase/2-hydroxyglutaryl-CoA dehydratase subunit BcrC/BadD/HgdB|uniref:Benzoyl-CoA reductase/2-hydroxyglutaryl-CoA dehydratase subunit, BcrC/BadD/HgdB n=1 Tax=Paramaledivibacter caminithermalis (strain DSM 15212 / CIP 107654 / DViRD3) TaxID=1121301 RepID=A0A1M6QRU5_PARC5|nr:2-hydroxyacyl-CoA dehydratase family protein [Paramaledivibacter caminithermalis]SHK22936.1 Benzoyl-CoA reductase/2-hydroxyglutaryl-CoA dehydratase subunit, BcrC/BadD/HgdB [Paramaledivibacter caminithermalis DSM 15212]